MIFFHTFGGRLGNQMFQAAFASTLAGRYEKVLFTKMEDCLRILPRAFKGGNVLRNKFLYKLFDRILYPYLLRPLIFKLRLVTLVQEVNDKKMVNITPGIFKEIKWVEGYFQGQTFFDPQKVSEWEVNPTIVEQAKRWLSQRVPRGRVPVAVHWRMGDYENFIVYDKLDASLPETYFVKAIEKVLRQEPKAYFVIFSDEPHKAAQRLKLANNVYTISDQSPEIDLITMSLCEALILSNSTLSWWSGWFAHKSAKLIIAPKWWMGWKSKRTFPVAIEPDFAELIDVE